MIAIANEPKTKFGASKGFKPMPSAFSRQCTHTLGSGRIRLICHGQSKVIEK